MDEGFDVDSEDLSMDIDSIFAILNEDSECLQNPGDIYFQDCSFPTSDLDVCSGERFSASNGSQNSVMEPSPVTQPLEPLSISSCNSSASNGALNPSWNSSDVGQGNLHFSSQTGSYMHRHLEDQESNITVVAGENSCFSDAISNPMVLTDNVNYGRSISPIFNNVESMEMPETDSCRTVEVPSLSSGIVGSNPHERYQNYDGICGYEHQSIRPQPQSSFSSNDLVGVSNSSMTGNHCFQFIPPNEDLMFHIDVGGSFSSAKSFLPKSSLGIYVETQDSPFTSNKLMCLPTDVSDGAVITAISADSVESSEKECNSQGVQHHVSTKTSLGIEDTKSGVSSPVPGECKSSQTKVHEVFVSDYENLDTGGSFDDKKVSKGSSMAMPLNEMKAGMNRKKRLDPNTGSCTLDANSALSTVTLDLGSPFDENDDVCIIEDSDECVIEGVSRPVISNPCRKLVTPPQPSTSSAAVGSMRLKSSDERLILRVALQDLSQPKSEISPPDGSLTVPLLRHQRIALSWMVQKETSGWHCSGGILADDQGLGKTVSTIALILKERPTTTVCDKASKRSGLETLNLEDDNEAFTKHVSSCDIKVLSKGRPSAGTLIVCPTSVLRQWDEELNRKVTKRANLSVLVYHGSNRTRVPYELAKYDVVLTTYSIVSMEVPKQPAVDDDDGDREKLEASSVPSNKKRKQTGSVGKRCSKGQKGMDGHFSESDSRPLAKVGWFRVVLDEAQTIKNHRTQVARACWGLRAKRRWCLSGTPIQNTIDDLYSYFRFLRYDPFVSYKAFYSAIKVPISRCPASGYKKLQAVLKTVMLRRTKGTLLDGKPIVTLPPKLIELKKVDFSEEERDFYTRLEADSRAQFEVYAAAGTVKQNYVNILLMLLRLRQACDHPLLVRRNSCNFVWESSLESARKIPLEKQASLLSNLEASLSICNICNDAPEDAMVAVCGHVFCNQCISEHLTSDNSVCPSWDCKFRLNSSSIFSRDTLSTSIRGRASLQHTETVEATSDRPSFDSSKIKAAIEVLGSLSTSCKREIGGTLQSSGESGCWPENPPTLGEKAIVFSQWTRMLDLLEECLKKSSIQYRRLDGTMSVASRDRAVKDFNALPEVTVMIMSLKAASLGLNMVAACHVLLLDLWWNPTTEDQAIDRAHRIGQTRPVKVLRLTVQDTVEDRILALQQKKREMVASAFGEDETGARQGHLTVDDLRFLFTA